MSRESPFGAGSSGLKRLMRREIGARRQRIQGKMISPLRMLDDDGLGSSTWVGDVAVGKLRPYKDVQVKAGASGDRFYAGLGMPVTLERNTQGRFDVIGPGDRVTATAIVKKYTLGNTTAVSTANLGVTFEILPFEHLKGPTPGIPGTSLWGDGATPLKTIRAIDGDGNPIP